MLSARKIDMSSTREERGEITLVSVLLQLRPGLKTASFLEDAQPNFVFGNTRYIDLTT